MARIDREGIFKARVIEHAVTQTRNGFPQWQASVYLVAKFDEEAAEPVWIDWSEYNMSVPVYSVLCNNDQKLLNWENVERATGWDGNSFQSLDGLDLTDHVIQVRIEEDTYDGKTRLKVQWVDAADSDPYGNRVKKLAVAELQTLSAKFSAFASKKSAPVPVKRGGTSTKPMPTVPTAPKKVDPSAVEAPATAPVADSSPAPVADSASTVAPVVHKKLTTVKNKETAWAYVVDNAPTGGSEEVVNDAWIKNVQKLNKDEATFTAKDWKAVADTAVTTLIRF